MRIFDTHCHIFPQNVFDKVWAYFDKHHWPIQYRVDEDERMAFLEPRVDAYTTLCYAHKEGMAAWLNDYVIRYAQAHPKAVPTGTFHPVDEDIVDYVEYAIESGLRGFKMHIEVQKFDPGDKRLKPVFDLLVRHDCVVTVHTAGFPLAGEFTGIEPFRRMLKMAPNLKVIVAHIGGGDHAAYFSLAADHPLYFDTAMVGVDYEGLGALSENMRRHIVDNHARFVFGSDFPNIPYAWAHQVDAVGSWGLSERQLDDVFYLTAAGLYGIR